MGASIDFREERVLRYRSGWVSPDCLSTQAIGGSLMGFMASRYAQPQVGQVNQLRDLLRESVQLSKTRGWTTSLSAQLFSPLGPMFEVTSVYNDLGAYEHAEAERERDDEFQSMIRRVQSMLARPTYVELFETLVSPAPHAETLPEYRQNVRYYAALGKAGELQSAL